MYLRNLTRLPPLSERPPIRPVRTIDDLRDTALHLASRVLRTMRRKGLVSAEFVDKNFTAGDKAWLAREGASAERYAAPLFAPE